MTQDRTVMLAYFIT